MAPQYCDTLSGLYGYLQNRLIQAHAEKSESMLQEVLQLIQTLLDGWIGAMDNLNSLDAAVAKGAACGSRGESAALRQRAERALQTPYSTKPGAEPQSRSWQF